MELAVLARVLVISRHDRKMKTYYGAGAREEWGGGGREGGGGGDYAKYNKI